jgi:hypothetical protein
MATPQKTQFDLYKLVTPFLVGIIGFFSIRTLNGYDDRLKSVEGKLDELLPYKLYIKNLAEKATSYNYKIVKEDLYFKPEDFFYIEDYVRHEDRS